MPYYVGDLNSDPNLRRKVWNLHSFWGGSGGLQKRAGVFRGERVKGAGFEVSV